MGDSEIEHQLPSRFIFTSHCSPILCSGGTSCALFSVQFLPSFCLPLIDRGVLIGPNCATGLACPVVVVHQDSFRFDMISRSSKMFVNHRRYSLVFFDHENVLNNA